jgi:hypothetical protein
MNKVVHFEITSEKKERAKKFYADVFGWIVRDDTMPGGMIYTSAVTTEIDEKTYLPKEPGGINGAIIERSDKLHSPVITIGVGSIEETIKKAEASGGKAVGKKGEVPGMGYYAYLQDSEENIIGLWQDIK